MSNIHLDEEQLQQYALSGAAGEAGAAHIAVCDHCRLQVKAYQAVYSYTQEAGQPLLDMHMERLILDQLPAVQGQDKREARWLYGILFGVIALLGGVLIGYWGIVRRMLSGVTTVALVFGILLLVGVIMMQVLELMNTYQRKIKALNLE